MWFHEQVWNAQDPEDEVLAMIVRVKLDTTMGSMVRELIAPVAAAKEKEPFEAVSSCMLWPLDAPLSSAVLPSSFCSSTVENRS